MTAATVVGSRRWRLTLAIVLVAANLVLAVLNLAKHDLVRLSIGSPDDGEQAISSETASTPPDDLATTDGDGQAGDTTDQDGGTGGDGTQDPQVASPTTVLDATGSTTTVTVDDWPGGHGPVPSGPPEVRRAVITADGRLQLTGSAPDWATVSKIVQYAGEKLPGGADAIDNLLTWHPDADRSTQSGDVVMPNAALFGAGSSTMDPASDQALDVAAAILVAHPTVFAIVIGHADNRGDDALNARIAADRAAAVVDYLIAKGVVPGQIVVASAGEDAPVASNDTEEGRAVNRRAEIQFKNMLIAEGDR